MKLLHELQDYEDDDSDFEEDVASEYEEQSTYRTEEEEEEESDDVIEEVDEPMDTVKDSPTEQNNRRRPMMMNPIQISVLDSGRNGESQSNTFDEEDEKLQEMVLDYNKGTKEIKGSYQEDILKGS